MIYIVTQATFKQRNLIFFCIKYFIFYKEICKMYNFLNKNKCMLLTDRQGDS